jgi:tetratricopeptide (TPR) repeat protein
MNCPFCSSADVLFRSKAGKWECQACEERFAESSSFSDAEVKVARPTADDRAAQPKKIFFSYGHDANRELVDRFKADLESRGHQVWIDYKEIGAWDDWKGAITRGIHDSQLAIAFLSIHSTRDPGVCRNEVAMALQHFGKVYPVLVEQVPQESIPVTIAHLQWPDLSRWQEFRDQEDLDFERFYEEKFLEIVSRVEGEAGRFASEAEVLRRALNPSGFEGRFGRYLEGFTGRDWVLDAYQHWLDHQPSSRVFWVKAGPGFGKTALAVQMANRDRAAIVGTWFCDHQSVELRDPLRAVQTIAYQLALRWDDYRVRLLPRLGLFAYSAPERIEEARKEIAKKSLDDLFSFLISEPMAGLIWREHKLVILVDALDESAEHDGTNPLASLISGRFLELPEWIGFVVTSRPDPSVVPYLQGFKPFSIEAGDARNAADLHAYCSAQVGPLLPSDDSEVLCDLLVEKSEGMMLYLRLVAEGLREGTLDPDGLESLTAGLPGLHSRYHAAFEARFRKDFEKTIQPLLRLVMAAPGPIPLDLTKEVLGWSRETVVHARAQIGSYLVEEDGGLSLFHKTLGEWLGSENAGYYFADASPAAKTLGDFLWSCFDQREKDENDLTRPLRWEKQVISWLPKLLDLTDRKEDWEEIAELGSWFRERVLWDETEALYRLALEGYEKALGAEHPDTLTSVNNLGILLSDKGDYEGAEALFRRALEGSEKIFGPEHPITLRSVHKLGNVLKDKGCYNLAEDYLSRALDGFGKTQGPVDLNTLICRRDLGLLLDRDLNTSKIELHQTLDALSNALGPHHTETLLTNYYLACILSNHGDQEGAEEMSRQALTGYETILGAEHPETLKTVDLLAVILDRKNDVLGAEKLFRRALAGYNNILGPEHPDTLLVLCNFAQHLSGGEQKPLALRGVSRASMRGQKPEYEEIEGLYQRVLESRTKVLGPEHPATRSVEKRIREVNRDWEEYDGSTLSSNILYISQHEGAELFDSPPVAGRAREAYS